MNSYNLIVDAANNQAVLKMRKEALGGEDAMAFVKTIKQLPDNVNCLVLDMSNLEMVNSTGLGMIAKANNDLKARNVELVLSSVGENVGRLLEITHLNKIFKIVD